MYMKAQTVKQLTDWRKYSPSQQPMAKRSTLEQIGAGGIRECPSSHVQYIVSSCLAPFDSNSASWHA